MNRLQVGLAIAVLLLGALFLADTLHRRASGPSPADAGWLDLDAARIARVELCRRDARIVLERGEGGGWDLLAPVAEPADEPSVSGWINAVLSAGLLRVLEEASGPASFEAYGVSGVDAGSVRITFWPESGPRRRFWIGRLNPTGLGVYVRIEGRPEILLVRADLRRQGRAGANGFRRYDLFAVAADSIRRLELRTARCELDAVRAARGLWRLAPPDGRPLRRRVVVSVLDYLEETRIQEYLRDHMTPGRWAGFGLEPPEVDLRFEVGASARRHRLRVGGETGDGLLFARRDADSSLVTLTTQILDLVDRPLEAFLDRNPVVENYDLLDSVVVVWKGVTTCSLVADAEEWRVQPVRVEGEAAAALPTAARNVVVGLEDLQSDATLLLSAQRSPADVAPVHKLTLVLHWPHRTATLAVRWRSGEPFHWLQVDGEPTLYRIGPDLFLRARGLLLGAGLVPPDD